MYQQFLAFGWTQTADTGQGAFPAVSSAPSAAGYYAIFQAADALSSAYPITVKIEFWESSNIPYFGLTVGTNGTDGAGNLLTPFSTRLYGGSGDNRSLQGQSASTTNLLPCFASGDAGNMRFGMWYNNNNVGPDYYQGVGIIIARARDSNGNQCGNYVQVWGFCYSHGAFQTVFAYGLGTTNNLDLTGTVIAAAPNLGDTSWTNSGAIMVSPVMQNIGGLSNPTPDLLVGSRKDFPPTASAVITVYGIAHTYVALSSTNLYGFVQSQNTSLLMRYE